MLAVLATLCVGLAASVVWIGVRQQLPELGLLGAALAVLAAFSVVHCLATPPILRASPNLSFAAGALALPAGLAAGAPMLAPGARGARWIARRWRIWTAAWLAGSAAALSAAWFVPTRWLPSPGSPLRAPVVAVGVVGAGALVARHVRLYRIGHHPSSLVTAVGVGYLALVTVVDDVLVAASPAWWVARLLDLSSVLAAATAALVLARHQRRLSDVLAPVVSRDPLSALEIGLTPEVHAFVAALSGKDRSTRDHVVRVADLAIRAAVRAGLPARRLRSTGLAALLHDLGKLVVPSAILTKNGPLTDAEFAEITTHSAAGAALLRRSATLAPVADLVRWHHERFDGSGYPDGLSGEAIPFEAALVSVCDAWDAMTNDRHYRAGLGPVRAEAILADGAGAQWNPHAVAVVLDEIRSGRARGAFASVGDGLRAGAGVADSVCADAVADAVRTGAADLLASP
jgi:HD-GYP domain-containing protein (c-di-GMP phosphodiesterase class II)